MVHNETCLCEMEIRCFSIAFETTCRFRFFLFSLCYLCALCLYYSALCWPKIKINAMIKRNSSLKISCHYVHYCKILVFSRHPILSSKLLNIINIIEQNFKL